jgi:hypothetical protein
VRRSHLVGVILALLLAVLLVWKLRGGSSDEPSGEAGSNDSTATGGGTSGKGSAGGRASATPGSLGGKITRAADGSPVANATIAVAKESLIPMFDGDDTPSMVITTDANGVFTVTPLAAGAYSIGVTAIGLVPGAKAHIAVVGGERTTVDLALAAGGVSVTGTVNDATGGPIGGARVTATRSSGMPFGGGRSELVAITSVDGKYTLPLADGEYWAIAKHDDYTQDMKSFELHGQPITVDFVLAPGGTIRGVVVNRQGKPVPNAKVTASTSRGWRGGGNSATADDTGAFTLTGLGSGAVRLKAVAKGFASKESTVVELGIGEQLDGVRIVLDSAYTISGRVARAGKPSDGVPGVLVGCFSFSGDASISSEPTNNAGEFEIWGVKPGSYMLFAIAKDNVPEVGTPVEVADKDVTGITIEMATGVVLSGRVDPALVSSVGLEVDKDKIGPATMFAAMKVMVVRGDSDASGAFTLKGAPPGEMSIVATTTDGRKGKLAITVDDKDQTNLIVKLEPRASVSGKVLDERGAAVGGVTVEVRDDGGGGGGFRMSFGGGDSSTLTSPDGSFKLVGLEPGKHALIVADSHGVIPFTQADKKDHKVELSKAQDMTGVMLTVEARDGVIRGVVVGLDKAPVADAWVSIRPDFSNLSKQSRRDMRASFMNDSDPILTGADGKFTIDKLRRGLYQITVEGPKGASRASKLGIKTGDNVTLVLEPLGTLSGKVTSGSAPVAEFDIGCRGEGPGMRFSGGDDGFGGRRFTNADGSYTIERLAPGTYNCTVSSSIGTAQGKVVVATGPAKLDFSIQSFASITGVAVDAATGKPLPGLVVLVAAEGLEGKAFGELMAGKAPTTDATGRFVIEKVPIGKGQVHVAPKDATFNHLATRDYTATSGQRVDLGTIKLVPPRTGEPGTLGFFAAVTEDKLMIVDVKDDSPASKASMLVGDRIMAIDGRNVADLGADVAKQMVSPGTVPSGTTMALTLERASKPVTVTLVAEPF